MRIRIAPAKSSSETESRPDKKAALAQQIAELERALSGVTTAMGESSIDNTLVESKTPSSPWQSQVAKIFNMPVTFVKNKDSNSTRVVEEAHFKVGDWVLCVVKNPLTYDVYLDLYDRFNFQVSNVNARDLAMIYKLIKEIMKNAS